MKKIILSVALSLDGYIEGPKGEYDWCFTDQDYGLSSFLNSIDTVFMGRKSYELVLRTEGSSAWMPPSKKYVFSNTLKSVSDGDVVSGDIEGIVREIKSAPGKDIWLFGGAELTTTLMNLSLVDEIHIAIHPIVLGAGKPLFIDIKDRIKLQLFDSKVYETGLIVAKYRVVM
jgi:dihydrofolate reductase